MVTETAASTGMRMSSVDVMKGLFIVTIVIVHLFMLNVRAGERAMPVVAAMLYLGLLVFYVIAGYFYKMERTFKENMKRVGKLVFALAVTSFLLPAILYCWFLIFGQPVQFDDMCDAILRALWLCDLGGPIDHLLPVDMCYVNYTNYFLWPMAEGLIIFFALYKYVMPDNRKIIAVIIAFILLQVGATALYVRLPFYLQLCPIATALIFFGAALSKYKVFERIDTFQWRNPKYWAVFLISIAAAFIMCLLFPAGVKFDYLIFGPWGAWSVITFFITVIFVSIFYAYVGTMLSRIPVLSSFFILSGRHSLGLALYHVFIAKMIIAPFFTFDNVTCFPEALNTIQLIVIVILVLVICLVSCEFGPKLIARAISKDKPEVSA